MSSSRLPGKALLKIGSNPLLWHVIQRAKLCKNASQIVVATSNQDSDDPIEEYCKQIKIPVYRGSLNNLVERALGVMDQFDFEYIARVCGDRIFLDYQSIDIAFEICHEIDLVTNKYLNPKPGLTTEIFSKKMIVKLNQLLLTDQHKEHLTTYLYENKKNWKIKHLTETPLLLKPQSLTIDEQQDLILWQYIIEELEKKWGPNFHQQCSYKTIEELILFK